MIMLARAQRLASPRDAFSAVPSRVVEELQESSQHNAGLTHPDGTNIHGASRNYRRRIKCFTANLRLDLGKNAGATRANTAMKLSATAFVAPIARRRLAAAFTAIETTRSEPIQRKATVIQHA